MDIKALLKEKLASIVKENYDIYIDAEEIQLEHPNDEKWGDLSCNASFKVAKDVKQSPIEVAKKIVYEVSKNEILMKTSFGEVSVFKKIDFQAPGFVNFTYSDLFLLSQAFNDVKNIENSNHSNNIGLYRGQKVLFEYTDPNPFKVFHIGHLMSNAIGESLSRIYQYLGADLKRVNYQGDVGLHVAKSIWGLIKNLDADKITIEDLANRNLKERVSYLGKSYAKGASAYSDETMPKAKDEIHELNYLVYVAAQERLIEDENWTPIVDYKKYLGGLQTFNYELVKNLYYIGRAWSLEDFENLYSQLGTKFDGYYFESKVGEYGLDIVNKHIDDGVFERENGAVIFKGENVGLHTRVFVNSKGLPTYEAKDLGLAFLKFESFKYDKSFIVTANEITEYFKVVLKAMSMFNPELASKTNHVGHGVLRFKTGKMSSRTGEVLTGVGLIEETKQEILKVMQESAKVGDLAVAEVPKEKIALDLAIGAIKYSILKQSPGKDIIYDKDRAIGITGDTGPYLQYTHARANSIVEKAEQDKTIAWNFDLASFIKIITNASDTFVISPLERSLLSQVVKFDELIIYAEQTLAPSLICDYLFELSQRFNTFYNDIPILTSAGTEREFRLMLTKQVRDLLRVGLWTLGISAPDRV